MADELLGRLGSQNFNTEVENTSSFMSSSSTPVQVEENDPLIWKLMDHLSSLQNDATLEEEEIKLPELDTKMSLGMNNDNP